ncbi:hypothetical protein TrLO_g10740 [Triparma laevis f. longispina]|uniref:Uncharacterized protein n=1 Tax=Triparma laevis f. longispina TaxID=1714387 RepID=A0A9W6ZNV0_9STRA|nr:hypothetical protein TrLO_g10740 [Triparma laevis f. longispina]
MQLSSSPTLLDALPKAKQASKISSFLGSFFFFFFPRTFFSTTTGIANSKTSKILLHAATLSDVSTMKSGLHSFANSFSFTRFSDLAIVFRLL